jgi:hypothetical protein
MYSKHSSCHESKVSSGHAIHGSAPNHHPHMSKKPGDSRVTAGQSVKSGSDSPHKYMSVPHGESKVSHGHAIS